MSNPAPSQPDAPTGACVSQLSAFEILCHCHDHIGQRLNDLDAVGQELLDGAALGEPQLAALGAVLAFLDTAIPIHSADEEQSLFPRLREQPMFAVAQGTPMDCMEHEHVEHAALKVTLKRAMMQNDAQLAGRCARGMVADYRTHIRKEEDILYPMARELLTDPHVIDAMTEEMRARRREAGLLGC